MDTRYVFRLLRELTGQTSTQGLITTFANILNAKFSGVELIVYELHNNRADQSKEHGLLCIDCIRETDPVILADDSTLNQAFNNKEAVQVIEADGSYMLVLPVELYDKSISHLVKVTHHYQDDENQDLLIGLVEVFNDIFRMLHERGYDPLTRTLNRQAFDQFASGIAYANKLPERRSQFDNHCFNGIAILDIDNFKSINDRFGHAIGDETLVLLSQTIRSVLRQDDMFFRYGGEEFVVFIKEVDETQSISVLERCRQEVENRSFPQVGQVTISIGLATLSSESHPLESLSMADKALYYAKSNGRNQVQSYEKLLDDNKLEPVEPIEGSADFWEN